MPLKEVLKLNIFQYGQDAKTVSQRSGREFDVKIEELRKTVLSFRVADGYTPKSKLAGTDSILQLMQLLGQSQQLQQAFGSMLPGMFTHLAQLTGVRGLEEYTPQPQQVQQNLQQAKVPEQASLAIEQQRVDQEGAAAGQANAIAMAQALASQQQGV